MHQGDRPCGRQVSLREGAVTPLYWMKSKTAEKWLTTAQKIFVRWSPEDSGAVALCPRQVVRVIRIPAAMDIWIAARVTDLR